MGWKYVVFEAVAKSAIRLLRLNGPSRVASEVASLIDPVYVVPVRGHGIKFRSAGSWPYYRATTLLTKEPETIQWIDAFAPGETFYDIGANVGVYTLYAAVARGCRVVAFEPSAVNYALLTRNIELNALDGVVWALCLALSDQSGIGALNMQTTSPGGALSTFGSSIDHHGRPFTPVFRQAAIGMSLDAFLERSQAPFPQHIKIDVDGLEHKVVAGATRTLQNPRVKSALIELNEELGSHRHLVEVMTEWGFLATATRRKKPGATAMGSVQNYLFERRASDAVLTDVTNRGDSNAPGTRVSS